MSKISRLCRVCAPLAFAVGCAGIRLAEAQTLINEGTINNGQVVTTTVGPGEIASWTFNETAGKQAMIVSLSTPDSETTFIPEFSINYPDGTEAVGTLGGWPGKRIGGVFFQYTQSGSYTVRVQPRYNNGNTGHFTLNLVLGNYPYSVQPDGSGGTMYSSQTYSGTVTGMNLDQWNYTARAGDSLSFTVTGAPGVSMTIIGMNPDGTLDSAVQGVNPTLHLLSSCCTSQTGNYRIAVGNAFYSATPNSYTLVATGSSVAPTDAKSDGDCIPCRLAREAREAEGGDVGATGRAAVGDPVNVATGNLFETVTDYSTVGANPLSFVRSYNSMSVTRNLYPTLLGPNWRTNYDRYLRLISPTAAAVERADGQVINFYLVSGVWAPDTDIDCTLTNSGTTWTLTDSDDTTETYTATNGKGSLNSIALRNGYTQTLHYVGGVLSAVSDSYNRVLHFTQSSGLLTGVTTPDSLALTYGYTVTAGQSLLTSANYNTSPATNQTYLYENPSLPFALTGLIDENGNRYATWSYDGVGRATSSQLAGGANLTQVFYDDSTGNRTVTGPLGIQDTYRFTILQGIPKISEIDRAANGTVAAAARTFTYDANGYLNRSTDWNGNVTTYVNDRHGDPTTINEAVGSPVARTTNVEYDPTWVHLPHTVTKTDVSVTNTYDPTKGNLLTRTLTDTTSQSAPYSTNGQVRTWTYTWTPTGQIHTVRLPRKDVVARTTYAYAGGTLTSITDAAAHVTTVHTYTGGGLPLTITDPNGVLTTLAYDARLHRHTSMLTTVAGNLTTTWEHDSAGELTRLTLPDNSYTSYGYDQAHRINLITNALGETQHLTLDTVGNVTQTLWENTSAATTRQHNASFDALGRRQTDVGGVGQTTTFGYDSQGNVTSIQKPLSWVTAQEFDALNRLSIVTDPYTNTTHYAYDSENRPLSVTDPNGHATTFTYDGFGDAIEQVSPDNGTTVYHFDADGNLSQRNDAAHAIANLTHDALDRTLTRVYPADAAENVALTYDQSGHGDGIGRLTSVTDAAGALSLSYDERGNRLTNARTIGANTFVTSYAYDNASRVASIVYPTAGWTVTYARDAAGQVASVTATQPGHGATSLATSVTHLPFGPLASFAWGNGVSHTANFDLDYRQTNLTDIGAAVVQNLTYDFDADNNVHIITDAIKAANSQTLNYDELERLTSALSGAGGYGSLSYTYDDNGNRKTAGATRYTTAAASNRLTAIGATKVAYYATGNVNSIGTSTMTYNKANQLATATVAGTTSVYTYDAFGQRLEAQVASGATSVAEYDLAGRELTETNGGVETDYAYLDSIPIAVIQPANASIGYIHAERLGTPQNVTNASKTTVWSTTYQPFGVTGAITGSLTQNLRLPGQHADATGYSHNGLRDYDPTIGRYLESDPIGLAGGLNTYDYVWQNPTRWVDPSGLATDGSPGVTVPSAPASGATVPAQTGSAPPDSGANSGTSAPPQGTDCPTDNTSSSIATSGSTADPSTGKYGPCDPYADDNCDIGAQSNSGSMLRSLFQWTSRVLGPPDTPPQPVAYDSTGIRG